MKTILLILSFILLASCDEQQVQSAIESNGTTEKNCTLKGDWITWERGPGLRFIFGEKFYENSYYIITHQQIDETNPTTKKMTCAFTVKLSGTSCSGSIKGYSVSTTTLNYAGDNYWSCNTMFADSWDGTYKIEGERLIMNTSIGKLTLDRQD